MKTYEYKFDRLGEGWLAASGEAVIHSAPPLITAPAGRHEAAILTGGKNSLTRTLANGIILATYGIGI